MAGIYDNHQVECDLCEDEYDHRLEGATTECGACVCESCCDSGAVRYHHTDDECFVYLNDD